MIRDPEGCICPQDYVKTRCPVHDPDGTYYVQAKPMDLVRMELDTALAYIDTSASIRSVRLCIVRARHYLGGEPR